MNGDQNPATPPTGWQFNPGDTVNPASTQSAAVPEQPPQVPSKGIFGASIPTTTPEMQEKPTLPGDDAAQDFAADTALDQPADDTLSASSGDQIAWTASEYVAHQKTSLWYVTLVAVSGLSAGAIYLLTKDIISAVSILLIALIFGLSAARKPRVLEYNLDTRGLKIADKSYSYGMFRSFAVIDEGAFSSIVFVPMKRFMPVLTIYYAPEDENQIVAIIADHLPLEQRKRDVIDTLLHKIRF